MYTESHLGWLNAPHLPMLSPPVTAEQRVVMIPDQPEEGIDAGKDFEKTKLETPREGSTVHGLRSEHAMTMEKSWRMMMKRTD